MRGRWWSLRALERRSGRNRRQVTSSCDRIECRNSSVQQAKSARRCGARAGPFREQKQKAVRLEQLERSLVGHGETETLSTVRLEYRCKSSPRSPPVLKKKKSLDATRLLQARSRIPSSRPHGTIGPSASHVPKLDSIPRLHAPKLLTDLHHLHSSAHRFDPFK
jgi:hypothetical protein